MPISTQEAAEALNDIAHAQQRASILQGYERGAPHFILWGLIWVLGYGLSDAMPAVAGPIWLMLDLGGLAGSFLLGRAALAGVPRVSGGSGRRFGAASVTIFAFILGTYFILPPHDAVQFGAFPALLTAAIYTGVGIWRGIRWVLAGIVLGACTLGGYALFKEHFMLWMAVAGGGTLLLTGLWLRRS